MPTSKAPTTATAATKADLDVDHLITLSGVADASDDLGTFTGSTISDNRNKKQALQDLETAVETKLASSGTKIIDGSTKLSGEFACNNKSAAAAQTLIADVVGVATPSTADAEMVAIALNDIVTAFNQHLAISKTFGFMAEA